MKTRSLYLVLPILVLLSGYSEELAAQSLWRAAGTGNGIALEILKPSFDGSGETTFLTSTVILSGRLDISDQLALVAELPFSNFGEEGGENNNVLGNPYVGLEGIAEGSSVFPEIGMRIPLVTEEASADAAISGLFTDFVDRAGTFLPKALTLIAVVNYRSISFAGALFRGRIGFDGIIPTDQGGSEFFILLALQGGYESQSFGILGGISARMILTAGDADLGERTVSQFGVCSYMTFGSLQPGLSLKLPLDEDLADVVDLVFGLNLTVNLN